VFFRLLEPGNSAAITLAIVVGLLFHALMYDRTVNGFSSPRTSGSRPV